MTCAITTTGLSCRIRVFSIMVLVSLLSASTRHASKRLAARAFTLSGVPTRRLALGQARPIFGSASIACNSIVDSIRSPRMLSSSSRNSMAVEEDLDSALEDILGDSSEQTQGGETKTDTHMGDSKSAPGELVEKDDPIDFNDPKFLSLTNTYWVKAGLAQEVLDVLSSKGITRFTPVQAEAFGPTLAGRDVIGRSRTGTGKTLAFGLPSLMRLTQLATEKGSRDAKTGQMRRGRKTSMVVLCPTRELARQVQDEIDGAARPLGLFTALFHGGVSYDPQSRALRSGIDVLVGTPGRIIDHIQRGNLDLSECEIAVLDEADEMLNMGFAEDVEVILDGIGSANEQKTQCLLFSATTPPWVKNIGRQYQKDAVSIDATAEQGGARTATTVRHIAIQVPPGLDSKKAILEDIIAVEISKDANPAGTDEAETMDNPLAAAAAEKKRKSSHAMQQKIFGKTIVFTETKRDADEIVSGGIFKSLTAQALHGDVGQKQRDATLNAFRAGAFNVLVATDVAARGIDIQDVDLVVQFQPPRDVDTYVHRSGRTGRAGKKGTSVLLFGNRDARDIVRIERDLGHGFKFELSGPPSTEAALRAAAKTSAIACSGIPDEAAQYFKEAAGSLLAGAENPEDIIAKCLAAISRRSTEIQSRSLLTGELGMATLEMTNSKGRPVSSGDVMFTVSKLSKMSRSQGENVFESDVGKIQSKANSGSAIFDMGVEDAKKLVEFSKDIDAGGAVFALLKELEIERDSHFGKSMDRRNGRFNGQRGGGYRGRNDDSRGGGQHGRGYRNNNNYHGGNQRSNYEGRHRDGGNRGRDGGGGGYRGRDRDGSGSGSGSRSRDGNRGGYGRREQNSRGKRYDSRGSDGW